LAAGEGCHRWEVGGAAAEAKCQHPAAEVLAAYPEEAVLAEYQGEALAPVPVLPVAEVAA